MKTCRKCGYEGDRFEKNRRVCYSCRYKQCDMDKMLEKQRQASADRYADPDIRQRRKETDRQWVQRNKPKKAAATRAYQAAKIQRTPFWADRVANDYVYHAAQVIKDVYGTSWEVDHIIPLQGKNVSGFHIAKNLQLMPVSENRSKSNKFEVG